jgi:hypothetical protein
VAIFTAYGTVDILFVVVLDNLTLFSPINAISIVTSWIETIKGQG